MTGYRVYRGGVLLATLGMVTSYQNTGLTPATSYSYTVQALDAAGNASPQSAAATATTQSVATALAISSVLANSDATNAYYSVTYTGSPSWIQVFLDTDRNPASGFPTSGIGAACADVFAERVAKKIAELTGFDATDKPWLSLPATL